MADNLWFGYENGGIKWFQVPDDYDITTESRKKVVDGVKYFSMGRVYWYTNLDTAKRHEAITLYKHYTPEEFPTYTNYPAIEVAKVADIPMDYDGAMGVPITFLDRYNPDQFEILGSSRRLAKPMSEYAKRGTYMQGGPRFYVPVGDGTHQRLYDRIVIRRIGGARVKIELNEITVRQVAEGYVDSAEEGVVGYGGRLDIRPKYQREFVYDDKKRNAVIDTIRNGFPLNVMYWVVTEQGTYEVMDGQQRTISFCQYVNGDFSVRSAATRWRSTTCRRRCKTRSSTTR